MNITSGEGAVYGYSGQPGSGNLYIALSAAGGADNYGNTFATGLNALAGSVQGFSIVGSSMDATSTLNGTQIQQAQVLNPGISGGTAVSMTHTITNTGGSVLGYTSGSTSVTFSTAGIYSWTCPTGVTSIQVQCWAAGGGGDGGNASQGGAGGGGGEYAAEPNFAVTPGNVYTVIVGTPGIGGVTSGTGGGVAAGSAGGGSGFSNTNGQGQGVGANGGSGGIDFIGGEGGFGSANTIHFDGGNGANGSGDNGGGGAGGSASASGEGNNGTASASNTGGVGGSALVGGGAGGAGGNLVNNGSNGGSPGGGGGGAGADGTQTQSATFTPNGGTQSYYGGNAEGETPNSLRDHDGLMYQGQPSVNSAQGYQYSVMTLPYTSIQSTLSGQVVSSVVLDIKCLHAYYGGDGMTLQVGYTSQGAFGTTLAYPPAGYTAVQNYTIYPNDTAGFNLGVSGGIGVALQNGNCKALIFGDGAINPWQDYYGYMDSGANNGFVPSITVYYSLGGAAQAGNGGPGQVVITYNSASPTYTLSVSAAANTDTYGNPYNPGFTSTQVTVLGSQAPSTTPTAISNTNATSAAIAANTAGQLLTSNAASFTGAIPAFQVDTSVITANGASSTAPTNITKAYVIPAGDPQVGTTYLISTSFTAEFETGSVMAWGINVNGTIYAQTGIGSGFFSAATSMFGQLTGQIQFSVIGASGACRMSTYGGVGINGNRSAGPNNNNAWLGVVPGTVAINTSVANTVAIYAAYSALETGQTCSGVGSTFQRLGP